MKRSVLKDRRIFVVEDEMLVLMVLEDMLEEIGCRSIVVAATLDDALRRATTEKFDAAFIDVNLNGRRSYPVAEVLAARGIPFAFSTGYSDHGSNAAFDERPVLYKPYRLQNLVAICEAWFAPGLDKLPRLPGEGRAGDTATDGARVA